MRTFALNVYFWGDSEQSRLMTDCLGPAAYDLWRSGSLRRVWFSRFDARGPHLLVLFGSPDRYAGEVRGRLVADLETYLSCAPSTACIDAGTLARRHAECRGKQLCLLDGLDGIAANNTFLLAEERDDVFLFGVAAGSRMAAEVDHLLAELTFWSVEQLRAGQGTRSAIRWVIALDGALNRAGVDAGPFWQFYASTLFPELRERIRASDPGVVEALRRSISARNEAMFAAAWAAAESEEPIWPPIERLVRVAIAASEGRPGRLRWFIRALTHAVMGQLGIHVICRAPLVLHAWLRRSSPHFAEPLEV